MKAKKTQVSIRGELRGYDLKSILRGCLDVVVAILALTTIKFFTGVETMEDLMSADFVAMLIGSASVVLSKTARKLVSKTEYVE